MFTQMVFIPPFHARHRGHSSKVVPVTLYSRGKSLIGFDPRSSVDGSNLLRINILVRNGEGTIMAHPLSELTNILYLLALEYRVTGTTLEE